MAATWQGASLLWISPVASTVFYLLYHTSTYASSHEGSPNIQVPLALYTYPDKERKSPGSCSLSCAESSLCGPIYTAEFPSCTSPTDGSSASSLSNSDRQPHMLLEALGTSSQTHVEQKAGQGLARWV